MHEQRNTILHRGKLRCDKGLIKCRVHRPGICMRRLAKICDDTLLGEAVTML
jgi:hypothetical protein